LKLQIRKHQTFVEHVVAEAGRESDPPLRKVTAAAIVSNPFVGRYVDDLTPLVEASAELGRQLADLAVAALGPFRAQSYGKAAIVGLGGEQEHGNALLTTTFANPLRDAIGGGKAWISSMTKRAAPGASIDIPLASKDALYVRSHYDGMTVTFHDAPLADEVVVMICLANRGRLNARVGGPALSEIKGVDGLT
jgi:hypothetical protein